MSSTKDEKEDKVKPKQQKKAEAETQPQPEVMEIKAQPEVKPQVEAEIKPQEGAKIVEPPEGVKVYGRVTNGQYLVEGGIPRLKNKVAIVGFAPSSMTDVKVYFNDPEWEIWGLNQLYLAFPQIVQFTSRWFQIHPRREYDLAIRDHKHHDWLREVKDMPIYMQAKEPDVPMSIPFPKDEILEHFGRYFTNSISWEIALAIHERFERIDLYGVDMAQDDEYAEQRPSCEFFCGWIRGYNDMAQELNKTIPDPANHLPGMKVYVPPQSDLLKALWLYPFEDDAPFKRKCEIRRQELRDRINQTSGQEQGAHDTRMQLLGAAENMNYIERTWGMNVNVLARSEGMPLGEWEKMNSPDKKPA